MGRMTSFRNHQGGRIPIIPIATCTSVKRKLPHRAGSTPRVLIPAAKALPLKVEAYFVIAELCKWQMAAQYQIASAVPRQPAAKHRRSPHHIMTNLLLV